MHSGTAGKAARGEDLPTSSAGPGVHKTVADSECLFSGRPANGATKKKKRRAMLVEDELEFVYGFEDGNGVKYYDHEWIEVFESRCAGRCP